MAVGIHKHHTIVLCEINAEVDALHTTDQSETVPVLRLMILKLLFISHTAFKVHQFPVLTFSSTNIHCNIITHHLDLQIFI